MTGIGRHRSNSISALSRHTPPSHPFATMRVNTQLNVLKFSGKFQTLNRNWGIGMNKGLSVYCCCCFISITCPQCPPPLPFSPPPPPPLSLGVRLCVCLILPAEFTINLSLVSLQVKKKMLLSGAHRRQSNARNVKLKQF